MAFPPSISTIQRRFHETIDGDVEEGEKEPKREQTSGTTDLLFSLLPSRHFGNVAQMLEVCLLRADLTRRQAAASNNPFQKINSNNNNPVARGFLRGIRSSPAH